MKCCDAAFQRYRVLPDEFFGSSPLIFRRSADCRAGGKLTEGRYGQVEGRCIRDVEISWARPPPL